VGAAIAVAIPNPYIAVPFSVAMHLIGDMVPHWDFYSNTTKEQKTTGWRPIAVMADLALGVFIGTALTAYALWFLNKSDLALNIFLCSIGSNLPDALSAPAIFNGNGKFNVFKLIQQFQSKIQFQAPLPWGILTQALIGSISLLLFYLNIR
jgi:hypothetical protein